MEHFSDLLPEAWPAELSPPILAGMAAAILVFAFEIVLLRKQARFSRKKRKKELAISRGHVIQARRVEAWSTDETGYDDHILFHAIYVYEVNGRTLKYRYLAPEVPPMIKTLYYLNDPRKVFDGRERQNPVIRLLACLLPLAAAVAVINLLGGI